MSAKSPHHSTQNRSIAGAIFAVALALSTCEAALAGVPKLDVEMPEFGPHHLSVVVGGTTDSEATAATLGLDYE